ncbi:MAG: hypothetical protein HW403_300 [Dehalococcoidia bacterium]|nr:hypothetical protein [Dehalococcoidia bacterium]
MGIIDTLSAGFSTVNRHLWLIAIPMVLDLIIWFSPPITIAPLAAGAIKAFEESLASAGTEVTDPPSSQPTEEMKATARQLAEAVGNFNLTALLAWQVPSLGLAPLGLALSGARIDVGGALAFVFIVTALVLGALLYAALYFGAVAEPIRGGTLYRGIFTRRIWSNGARFLGYYALVAAVTIPALLLLSLLGGLASLVSSALASFTGAVASVMTVAAAVYLFFVDEAIFVGNMGPVQAVRSSLALIWRNYWTSLLLMVVINVLLVGTHIAWSIITKSPAGAMVAILGNGYIATGLTAAAMIFYRQRALGW